ncbi:2-dehydro-3-deoxy-6-phosphogalactonate aldolase [Undibacterium flavidum]|uniref:2-dehydro-3-deoxy-6-phosphogalactonate aldolase n=1 Tax=Undibacterium flavidum TaxID=2762297 RepID=A0ABR6Y7C7_9BURK|nr:2-dehydro-3-deoxy-6-phosphogalactonate aldolase [Undibacterium flavidum]MBC3872510.1 2-dehydro-3-deoxy-6-phosphogalactonate aldolase [Undibacterium flavidum]
MRSTSLHLQTAVKHLPLIAILRGIRPAEVESVALSLYRQGFRLIEVPLTSPEALRSIAILRDCLPADALFGAGTVTQLRDVFHLRDLQANLVVMPHVDLEIVRAAKAADMICIPGVSSVTEAFAALQAGADALKLYPAELISAPVLKAMRTVLSSTPYLFPVGGIGLDNMDAYLQAGASGFGLGGSLYSAGMSLVEVENRAAGLIQAWHSACQTVGKKVPISNADMPKSEHFFEIEI